jgi:hypothetical protein
MHVRFLEHNQCYEKMLASIQVELISVNAVSIKFHRFDSSFSSWFDFCFNQPAISAIFLRPGKRMGAFSGVQLKVSDCCMATKLMSKRLKIIELQSVKSLILDLALNVAQSDYTTDDEDW